MLAHLDDLASDFSAIHGVRDITGLPGRVFFRLAFRLTAYQGVMRERVINQVLRDQEGTTRPAPGRSYQPAAAQLRQMVPATKAALEAEPSFRGIFSFSPAQKQDAGPAEDLRPAAAREYPELRQQAGEA